MCVWGGGGATHILVNAMRMEKSDSFRFVCFNGI